MYGFKNNKEIFYNMQEMVKLQGKDRENNAGELTK
jgi:hypothetical protein